MEVTDLLIATAKHNASDLHLSPGNSPLMRVDGDIHAIDSPALTADAIKTMIYSTMTEQQRSDYERDLELDFSVAFGDEMRFRVNAFNSINGPAAVFRSIPTEVLSMEAIGAPDIFKEFCKLHKGIILVTGPTGSGKSTTLAAMIDYINSHYAKHILTIEDPVEFVHKSKQSLINQREVGSSTKSFGNALKSALREDPDVILVGEMRDLETISLALTAAETGHLVMGTLHTSSAAKTIDRIIDVFPADDKEMVRAMLSVSVEAIIAQKLLKKEGGGRVAAHEILIGTPAIRNLIRENKIPQISSMMQVGSKQGMCMMKDVVYKLLDEGIISNASAAEALAESEDSQDESGRRGSSSSGGGMRQAGNHSF